MHSQLLPLPSGSDQNIINLDLGIGSSGLKKIKREKREPLFTAAQFQQLYNQILVYNYIALGLPLLFPSWISVFNSFGPAIYNKYPSCQIAEFSPHKSEMDPEPGRCRRTDGRKWRCSKNVIPQQKYCERHMHRGRQRSRKHVEPIPIRSDDNITSVCNKMPKLSSDVDDKITVPSYRIGVPAIIQYRDSEKQTDVQESKSCSDEGNCRRIGSSVGFVSSGFGLSPKSVLHSSAGKPESQSVGNKRAVESERERCRRTDGKKWQCRRGALPNQKYCESHMHRGAKKLVSTPQSVTNGINLNTTPTTPQQNNSTSSMSDATTITD